MTNFEKYRAQILEIAENGKRVAIDKYTKKVQSCNEVICWNCVFYNGDASCSAPLMLWLYEEYQELPPVDWSTVAVDTPILISEDGKKWHPRHFAKYENGRVYTWADGGTSWSTKEHKKRFWSWEYAKLAEGAE